MDELLVRYPMLEVCKNDIEKVIEIFINTYKNKGKILLCGNGGSCADCDHIVGELMKGFLSKRPLNEQDADKIKKVFGEEYLYKNLQYGIPAISLPAQTAVLTAFVNDVKADMVYAQLIYGYGMENDTAVGLSTSGNSKNVINAMKIAKAKGLKTVAFTGQNICQLDEVCDVVIKVPEKDTYKIQELHLPVYHYICAEVEARLFNNKLNDNSERNRSYK